MLRSTLRQQKATVFFFMSFAFLCFAVEYLDMYRHASPQSYQQISSQAWRTAMMSLPLHYVFEQLKAPLRNYEGDNECIFRIPHEDIFYLDLFGSNAQEVLGAEELQKKMTDVLLQHEHPGMVWTICDARSGGCRALLHWAPMFHRKGHRPVCTLRNLYVQDDELTHPMSTTNTARKLRPVQEILLQALCTFADRRGMDVQVMGDGKPFAPVVQLLLAGHGFLNAAHGRLVRPPWCEVVRSNEILCVIERQLTRLICTQSQLLNRACRSGDASKSKVASTEPSTLSRIEPMPIGSPFECARDPVTGTSLVSFDIGGTTPTAPHAS